MPTYVTQQEYVNYTQYMSELKLINKLTKGSKADRICYRDDSFSKYPKGHLALSALDKAEGSAALKGRISFINKIHGILEESAWEERNPGDCTALAAAYFNTSLKVIDAWNKKEEMADYRIQLPHNASAPLNPVLEKRTAKEIADEKALSRYFELADQYPQKIKGNPKLDPEGTYQIVYDREEIAKIQQECYEKQYQKLLESYKSPAQAEALAANNTRIGLVYEDQYLVLVRDAVVSPHAVRHTYIRVIWKSDLDKIGGVGVLLADVASSEKKIVLELTFRHALRDWMLELPRGFTNAGETPEESARREAQEETGSEIAEVIRLGGIHPDTGLEASYVPIFYGEVVSQTENSQDDTEAIQGSFSFTLKEIIKGYEAGYLDIEAQGKTIRAHMTDPFLSYAIWMAQSQGLLTK